MRGKSAVLSQPLYPPSQIMGLIVMVTSIDRYMRYAWEGGRVEGSA